MQDLSQVLCLWSAVAYRADGMAAENKRLREKVSALEKEIQGAMCALSSTVCLYSKCYSVH